MLNGQVRSGYNPVVPLHASLWRCETCNSFVAIHSAQTIHQSFCPICRDSLLENCGGFDSILGIQLADA
jgi:hypothetical protein